MAIEKALGYARDPAVIKPDTPGLVEPGVTYTEGVLPDYYTHYCLPEDWLLEK